MKTTRTPKTPQQRAEDAVGVLERRLTKLRVKHARASADLAGLDLEIGENERRLAYAKSNPDLPTTTKEIP